MRLQVLIKQIDTLEEATGRLAVWPPRALLSPRHSSRGRKSICCSPYLMQPVRCFRCLFTQMWQFLSAYVSIRLPSEDKFHNKSIKLTPWLMELGGSMPHSQGAIHNYVTRISWIFTPSPSLSQVVTFLRPPLPTVTSHILQFYI